MLGVEALRDVLGVGDLKLLVPPEIAVIVPVDLISAALDHKHVFNARTLFIAERLVNGWL